jgi:flagellar biogenesis protein FliO
MSSDRQPASPECRRLKRFATLTIFFSAWCLASAQTFGQITNSAAVPLTAPSLPDTSLSVFRVFGSLALVIGLFLGGVWLFRNWQRLVSQRGRAPKLNILETRSLGGRHTVHVIGYEQQRFLIASSPGGVNLVSHLPVADEVESLPDPKVSPLPSFAQALTQVLKRK